MLRRILAGLILASATSVGLGVAVDLPASAAGPIVIIRNTGNGECLQPTGGPADIGTPVVQEPCDGSAAQNWSLVPLSDGSEQFVNQATGDCLDARGGATNGTPVQQWTCNTISNEKWASGAFVPGITQVVSRVSGTTSHCLDDPGQSTQPGTAMQIFACNTTTAQVWYVGPASAGAAVIRNTGNSKCLQTIGGTQDIGTPVVQEPCDGSAAQNWIRMDLSDGSEQFINQATGDCLDARGGATNGTPVQQWTCNTISNEKWASAVPFPVVTQVVSRVSGTTSHCLDDPGQSTQDGTAMQIFACNTTSAQVWFIG
jgi:hypothetical protein